MKKIIATACLLAFAFSMATAQTDTTNVSPAKVKLKKLEDTAVNAVKKHKSSKKKKFSELRIADYFALGFHSLELSGGPEDRDALPFTTRSREITLGIAQICLNPKEWLGIRGGFDIKWDQFGFNDKKLYFTTEETDKGMLAKLAPNTVNYNYLKSFVKTTSLVFPISLDINIGKFTITGGAEFAHVMDRYSRVIIRSKINDYSNEDIVHGILLNNNCWNYFGAVKYDGFGLYFKYSPDSIITEASNFRMNHYTVGFVVTM